MNDYKYLLSDINKINGIGNKTAKLFKKKNINTIFDLLWSAPRDYVDTGNIVNIKDVMLIMSGNANSSIINSCNFSNSNSFIPGLELANYIVGQNSGNTIIGFAILPLDSDASIQGAG